MTALDALRKLGRIVCTVYVLVSLMSQWIVTCLFQFPFIAISYPFISTERREDICGHIFRKISFIGMDLLNPFWTIHKLNQFPEVKNKKVILMLNHVSAADPFVSIRCFLPRDGTWIAKDDLFKVPFGGWALYNSGDLAVRFKDKKTGFATVKGTVGPMMENARARLRRGRMLCVFPEGVRNANPDGPLGPFRLGFFSLAIEEGATIVPLSISGTDKMWPKAPALMNAAHAYYSYGEPVNAADFKSAEELAERVWQVITEARETHPDRIALHAAQAKTQVAAAEGEAKEGANAAAAPAETAAAPAEDKKSV